MICSSEVGIPTHEVQNLLKRFPESFYNEKKYLGEKAIFPEAQKSEFYKQIPVPDFPSAKNIRNKKGANQYFYSTD